MYCYTNLIVLVDSITTMCRQTTPVFFLLLLSPTWPYWLYLHSIGLQLLLVELLILHVRIAKLL